MQAEYVYSPWGEIISAEGDLAEVNPLRYRGYYYDSETGFYYLRSRYYDPENHRFINADTYASTDSGDAISCNMFAYCGNNPVMRGDENGEIWAWLAGALVGAVSSAISETVHQVAEHFINGTPIIEGAIPNTISDSLGGIYNAVKKRVLNYFRA